MATEYSNRPQGTPSPLNVPKVITPPKAVPPITLPTKSNPPSPAAPTDKKSGANESCTNPSGTCRDASHKHADTAKRGS